MMKRTAKPRVVYVVAHPAGLTKIGHTTDLRARLRSLQARTPQPITLVAQFSVPGEKALEIEAACHAAIAADRVFGEWFMVAPELAIDTVKKAVAEASPGALVDPGPMENRGFLSRILISYPVSLEPDDNGTFLATCPDLPGVVTFGGDETDALRHASGAIEEWLGQALHNFAPIPRPSAGAPRAQISLHATLVVELYWALAARGWTRADLQRATGWHRPQVDRLFDLRYETKSGRLEVAFLALGVEPHIEVREAA